MSQAAASTAAPMTTIVHPDVTFDHLQEAIDSHDNPGMCIACGCDAGGVEPDAEKYPCDECGKHTVYGVEQVVLLGLFH